MDDRQGVPSSLQYSAMAMCLTFALGTVALSFVANPISTSWLIGLYITCALLFISFRQWRTSPLFKSYTLYLLVFFFYQFVIWVVHVTVPGSHPEEAKHHVVWSTQFLGFGGVYMGVAIYHFTLHFSEARSRVWFWLDALGWLIGVGFHLSQVLGLFFGDFHWKNGKWVPTMSAHYPYFFGYITLYVTLGLAIPLAGAIRHPDRKRRVQLAYYLAGAFPLWLSCWSHFLMSMGVVIPTGGGIFIILHALILAYAVFRHRLYDITLIIRRGLLYVMATTGLGVSFGTAVFLSLQWAEAWGWQAGLGGVAVVAGIVYAPLFAVIHSMIDKFFHRARKDREALLADYSKAVSATLELDRVMLLLGRILYQAISPSRVCLYMKDDVRGDLVPIGTYEEGLKQSSKESNDLISQAWLAWLREHTPEQVQTTNRLPCEVPDAVPGFVMDEGPERLVIPIKGHGTIQGYAVLGAKRSDEPYLADDLQFAETVAASSSVALYNARSYHQIRQMHRLLRDTLQGMSAGVLLVRHDGRVELSNESFEKLLVRPPQGGLLPGTHLAEWRSHDPELIDTIAQWMKSTERLDNLPINQVLPQERFLMVSKRVLQDEGAPPLFLFLIHDLSAFKRMEDDLKRKEALARVGELVSGINHEIRGMIQPIRTSLSRLQELDLPHPIFQRSMKVIPERIALLDLMLENLRNYTRPIELRRRPVSAHKILSATARDLTRLAEDADAQVELEPSVPDGDFCLADRDWLGRVFYNLLRNALEAVTGCTDRQVRATISKANAYVVVAISDSGTGIRPENMRSLFQPFFSTKGRNGTGLGLCLCKKLVELHKGKLEVESELEKGTTVRVYLPVSDSEYTPIPESRDTGRWEG